MRDEMRAIRDGFKYSGCWHPSYEVAAVKRDRAKLKAEGYRVRTIERQHGKAMFIKDTAKTLKAKEEAERQVEERRLEKAAELRRICEQIDFDGLALHQLVSICQVIQEETQR